MITTTSDASLFSLIHVELLIRGIAGGSYLTVITYKKAFEEITTN